MAARSAIRPFLGMGRCAVFGRMSSGPRFGVVMRWFRARFSVMVRGFSVMVRRFSVMVRGFSVMVVMFGRRRCVVVMVMVGLIPVPFQQRIHHHLARGEE